MVVKGLVGVKKGSKKKWIGKGAHRDKDPIGCKRPSRCKERVEVEMDR